MADDEFKVERTSTVFFIRLPDKSKAYLKYSVEGDRLNLIETYTPEAYRGKGLAKLMVDKAVEYAVKKGLKIVPLCSYSVYYFIKFGDKRVLLAGEYRDMGDNELEEYYKKRLEHEKGKRSS
ncbi:MAG: GNAT family N-acetyltransferase [Nitrososphaeria archaeon]